jgi:hypothetical protein
MAYFIVVQERNMRNLQADHAGAAMARRVMDEVLDEHVHAV